jgi:hypothetical protein
MTQLGINELDLVLGTAHELQFLLHAFDREQAYVEAMRIQSARKDIKIDIYPEQGLIALTDQSRVRRIVHTWDK